MSLHEAVLQGRVRDINRLVAGGADLRARDRRGNTPLGYLFRAPTHPRFQPGRTAVNLTSLSMVAFRDSLEKFLARGADPNALHADDIFPARETILMRAVRCNDLAAIDALLAAGADATRRSLAGRTALDIATETGCTPNVIGRLTRAGAVRSEPYTLCGAARCNDVTAVKTMLAEGADLEARERELTPLTIAAERGHVAIFHLLLEAGAEPAVRGSNGVDLLTLAAASGEPGICRSLLARGLDVNGSDTAGKLGSPLCQAAYEGHVEVVQLLLEAGAEAGARGRFRYAALRYAEDSHAPPERKTRVIALLSGRGPRAPQLTFAARPAAADGARTGPIRLDAAMSALADVLGRPGKPWPRRRGVYQFIKKDVAAIARAREAAQAHGCLLVGASPPRPGEAQLLLLFPTDDAFAVIRACGTRAVNRGLDNDAIIAWLRELARDHPFHLTGCGFDFVSGNFSSPVGKSAAALAARLLTICPGLMSEAPQLALAGEIQRNNAFLMLWD
jgi:ankyrin repeat protein